MQGLEVGEGRRGVPAVLDEAEVREGVGEVGGVHHLDDDVLLLIRLWVIERSAEARGRASKRRTKPSARS